MKKYSGVQRRWLTFVPAILASSRWSWMIGGAFVVGVVPAYFLFFQVHAGHEGATNAVETATAELESVDLGPLVLAPQPDEEVRLLTVGRGQTVYSMLRGEGISGADILQLVSAARPQFDLRRVQQGTTFRAIFSGDEAATLRRLEVDVTPVRLFSAVRTTDGWDCSATDREISRQVVTFQGLVNSSLWASAVNAGVDFTVIQGLTEVFAWQIDFSREVRPQDRWRLVIERLYVENEPIGWGNILAAEYINRDESYSAVWFETAKGRGSYYFPDGTSLRKMFLRSPIRFARISSNFNPQRFHPILKRNLPHNGVDYAAAPGTPIRAVGDGVIDFSGANGPSGNHINIRHNATYRTSYSHLKGFAPGISKGKRVDQGQIIGYVGSTGLATGPHLHFSFYEHGRFVDPLGRKFPSADPVPPKLMPEFTAQVTSFVGKLPRWQGLLAASKTMEEDGETTADEAPVTVVR